MKAALTLVWDAVRGVIIAVQLLVVAVSFGRVAVYVWQAIPLWYCATIAFLTVISVHLAVKRAKRKLG